MIESGTVTYVTLPPKGPTVVRLEENESRSVVRVWINYGRGKDQLSLSMPTGIFGGYQEARDESRARCDREIAAHIAELRTRFPDLIVK